MSMAKIKENGEIRADAGEKDTTAAPSTTAGGASPTASNPLVFAAVTEAKGDAIARDFSSTRHGREQIDVRKMQTQPYEAD